MYTVEADKGFNYLSYDDSFVCQKKNHFQLTVRVGLSPGSNDPKFIYDAPACTAMPVDGFYLHFHGIKVYNAFLTRRHSESAYICQVNFRGSRDSGHAPFQKFCMRSCSESPDMLVKFEVYSFQCIGHCLLVFNKICGMAMHFVFFVRVKQSEIANTLLEKSAAVVLSVINLTNCSCTGICHMGKYG